MGGEPSTKASKTGGGSSPCPRASSLAPLPLLIQAPSREWNRDSLYKWQLHGLATYSSLCLCLLIWKGAVTSLCWERGGGRQGSKEGGMGWREVVTDKQEVAW